jgi:hypothetical protein
MIICEEMKKLRAALDKMGVEWGDASDEWKTPDYESELCFLRTLYICRTHFSYNNSHYSVINGYGSFGGMDLFDHENKGFLEIRMPNGKVKGWLTSDEVIEILKEDE